MYGWLLHKHPTCAHSTHVLQPWSEPALELASIPETASWMDLLHSTFPTPVYAQLWQLFKKNEPFISPCLKSSWIPMSLRIKAMFPMMTCKAIHTACHCLLLPGLSDLTPFCSLPPPHCSSDYVSLFFLELSRVGPASETFHLPFSLPGSPSLRCTQGLLPHLKKLQLIPLFKTGKALLSQTSYYSFLFSPLTTI